MIDKTEPKTLFWVALKFDNKTYGIFDLFADESGQSEHFAGQVAALLKEKSSLLVQGGWDEGVVANIQNFEITASK